MLGYMGPPPARGGAGLDGLSGGLPATLRLFASGLVWLSWTLPILKQTVTPFSSLKTSKEKMKTICDICFTRCARARKLPTFKKGSVLQTCCVSNNFLHRRVSRVMDFDRQDPNYRLDELQKLLRVKITITVKPVLGSYKNAK